MKTDMTRAGMCIAVSLVMLAGTAGATTIYNLTDLGSLPGGSNVRYAEGGVSADGSVVVGASGSASGTEAFRWTSGGMVGLGYLDGDLLFSFASGASADGSVVVGQGTSTSGFEAFRWTVGVLVGLGDLAGGGVQSSATGVSADDLVVVEQGSSASGGEAYRWTSGGGMVGLGDFGGGSFGSIAYDVSADGSVVVGQGTSTSGFEAFRWTSGGGMVGLGDFGGGSFHSQAEGVNADGSVIVGRGETDMGTTAWVLDSVHQMRDLNTLVDPSEARDFYLTAAFDISAKGSIVGLETIEDNTDGFLLTPMAGPVPEPASMTLLGLGLVGVAVARRVRRRT